MRTSLVPGTLLAVAKVAKKKKKKRIRHLITRRKGQRSINRIGCAKHSLREVRGLYEP